MRAFVRQLASLPFFQSVEFANSRFNHDLVAAQLLSLKFAVGPTNIKNVDLNRMYSDNGSEAFYGLAVARIHLHSERTICRTAVMRARPNRSVETLRIQHPHAHGGAKPVRRDRCDIGRFSVQKRCQIRGVHHAVGQC
jgi:hypothetical protein